MESMLQDLRFGLRKLRRSPGFTLLAVATLAIGIGATTTIFSVLEGVLLRPLPYPRSDRLVRVWSKTPEGGDFPLSLPDFEDYREALDGMAEIAAMDERHVALTGNGTPESLTAQAVSAGFFHVLGTTPRLGRVPTAEETRAGARVVVLSHGVWSARFAADPAIVGRTIRADGEARTVVGVMDGGFRGPGDAQLWLPLTPDPGWERNDHSLAVVGRLAGGASAADVARRLTVTAERLGREHPNTNGDWGVRVAPLIDAVVGPTMRRTLWILSVGVGLLLLLACVNVASLLLGRAAAMEGEVGLRAALGARRGRIARQLLTESLTLGVMGAAAGIGVAVWGVPLLKRLLPPTTPRIADVRVDGAVLAFSVGVAILAGLLSGLVPALRASRPDLRTALGEDARTTDGTHRLRDGLVVTQTALATLLLVAGALLATSFVRLRAGDRGIDTRDVVVVPVSLSGAQYDEAGRFRFLQRATSAIASLPGVEAVGATNVAPLSGGGTVVDLSVEGQPTGPGLSRSARWRSVTPGFFGAAGVDLVSGRTLRDDDFAPDAPAVVVVTRRFAREFLPGVDPVGKRVAMGTSDFHWRTVVGVVEDVQDVDPAQEPVPLFYMPEDGSWPWMSLVVRSSRSATALAPEIRARIWSVDPGLPVPSVESMGQRLDRAVAGPRFILGVMLAFGAVALLLAAVGVYGVMAHFVTRRRREMGIRLALGGLPRDVARLVVGRGVRLAAAGLGLGLVLALAAGSLLRSTLYETAPTDPAAYLAVTTVLALVALAAVAVPAWRGARIDPMEMMR